MNCWCTEKGAIPKQLGSIHSLCICGRRGQVSSYCTYILFPHATPVSGWPEINVGGMKPWGKFWDQAISACPSWASVFVWAVYCTCIFWGRLRKSFLWAWHILVKMKSTTKCWHKSWLHHIAWLHATSSWPRAVLALALVTWFKTAIYRRGKGKCAWGGLTWHPSVLLWNKERGMSRGK